jgi:hypothetical protein
MTQTLSQTMKAVAIVRFGEIESLEPWKLPIPTVGADEVLVSQRLACTLLEVDRSTYRYEPRPDHNAKLLSALGAAKAAVRLSPIVGIADRTARFPRQRRTRVPVRPQ